MFWWKDKEDKLLEKKFTINDKYIITTFICGKKNEAKMNAVNVNIIFTFSYNIKLY